MISQSNRCSAPCRIPAIVYCLLGLLISHAVIGCTSSEPESQNPTQTDGKGSHRQPRNSAKGGGTANGILGQVADFTLTNQNGQSISRADLDGKVWIATFVFTRCTLTCPIQSQWMARLQERLRDDPARESIRFVSFSVDPTFDTPEVLREYADGLKADDDFWHFLTGSREEIWTLSKDSFHLPVAELPDTSALPIVHDPGVVLIDRQGRMRKYIDVVSNNSLEPMLQALSMVLGEFQPSPEQWGIDDGDTVITHLAQPPEILNTMDWLAARPEQQRQAAEQSGVFHDFQLTDSVTESGITFRNQILDEQRSRLQVNHYDHGNGLCTADIDADGLPDLYFVNQAGDNGLYRNLGNGKFEDITASSGLAVPGRIKVSASFADVNNDGLPDAFVTTVLGGNLLFLNQGEGRFRDVTADYGVDYSGHSSSAVFFDYDRDGFLDLFVANVGKFTSPEQVTVRRDRTTQLPSEDVTYYAGIKDAFAGHLKPELTETSLLYHNEGGQRFVEVSAAMGIDDAGWSGAAIPIDINEDGWMDLYVMNMQGHDSLYLNQDGKKFARSTDEYFPATPWGTMGGRAFDFDNDTHFDLLLTDMHSDMSETVPPTNEAAKANMQWPESFLKSDGRSIYGNAFYRSNGDGSFAEISDAVGAENFWPWGLSTGDLNADGFEDAFIASSMCFPYRYCVNTLLLNVRGERFQASESAVGLEPRRTPLMTPWFELDCDGADQDNPLCRDRTGKIVVWSAVGSRSSLLEDLDQDGDLDLVTNEFNGRPQVLLSDLSETTAALHYLKIRLEGTTSNRDGLGSRITVRAGDQTWCRQHDGQSGYLSQSSMSVYFGLGQLDSADSITVQWPSGASQTLSGPIEANQTLTIKESN